jgi:hypothetical protein
MSLAASMCLAATPILAQSQPNQPEEDPLAFAQAQEDGRAVQMAHGVRWVNDLTPGYVLIEGDIQVPFAQAEAMWSGLDSTFGTVTYWPVTVPYDFVTTGGGAVSSANQTNAINAMNAISARAGVIFRAATGSDANRIRFQSSSFNNSAVGMQGGTQIINITSWGTQIIICHEIFHSLGFWHEQSSPVRDTYVTINFGNVCGSSSVAGNACNANVCQGCSDNSGNFISCAFNFNITSGAIYYGPYDFDSFMHYGRTAFSCNGSDTITCKPAYSAYQNTIGQRDHFSFFDAITARGIYRFAGDTWWDGFVSTAGIGTIYSPWAGNFQSAYVGNPSGGVIYIRNNGAFSAIGTYNKPMTIIAPVGATLH